MPRLKHKQRLAHKMPKPEREPLAEQILKTSWPPEKMSRRGYRHFSKLETARIRRSRKQLIAQNLTDDAIAKILSKRFRHPSGSIDDKIRKMVKSGKLSSNPNKKEKTRFSDREISQLTSFRKQLISRNLNDQAIAKNISEKIGHSAKSVYSKIEKLVNSGQLPENPNKWKRAGKGE